jgi:hypothetical protein
MERSSKRIVVEEAVARAVEARSFAPEVDVVLTEPHVRVVRVSAPNANSRDAVPPDGM